MSVTATARRLYIALHSIYTVRMAMGKRERDRQPTMWVATTDLPTAASHPFCARLNRLFADQGFDDFAETACHAFYTDTMGRPGLPPGIYFRLRRLRRGLGLRTRHGVARGRFADIARRHA